MSIIWLEMLARYSFFMYFDARPGVLVSGDGRLSLFWDPKMRPISVFMDSLARGPRREVPDVLEREAGRVDIALWEPSLDSDCTLIMDIEG